MKIWRFQKVPGPLTRPLNSVVAHPSKTRDLVALKDLNKIYTLGTERTVSEWDAETFTKTANYNLSGIENFHEVVCIAHSANHGLLAVGSQNYLLLVDPRASIPVSRVPSQDSEWGVRSLCWRDYVISTGGGSGRISFYDIRRNQYQLLGNDSTLRPVPPVSYLQTGKGQIVRDEVYETHFRGLAIPHAAYTHCFDPTGLRLFVGGGPLSFGLKGSYAALW